MGHYSPTCIQTGIYVLCFEPMQDGEGVRNLAYWHGKKNNRQINIYNTDVTTADCNDPPLFLQNELVCLY